MKSLIRKAVKTFRKLADGLLLAFGRKVSAAVAKESESFPKPEPALADVDAELDNFDKLLKLAGTRDVKQVQLKNESRKEVIKLLSDLADYINYTAKNNEAAIAASLYDLSKIPSPRKLKAATRVALTDGENSGELVIKFKKPAGATGFTYQYNTDPSLPEKGWVSFSGTTASYTFTGLTRGVVYYSRVISLSTNLQEVESMVVNRVCN